MTAKWHDPNCRGVQWLHDLATSPPMDRTPLSVHVRRGPMHKSRTPKHPIVECVLRGIVPAEVNKKVSAKTNRAIRGVPGNNKGQSRRTPRRTQACVLRMYVMYGCMYVCNVNARITV
jgi:hypothetical protein